MSEFINTTAVLGDDAVMDAIITRTITEIAEDRVDSLAAYAFNSCKALTTANFPRMTSIGTSAFGGCSALIAVEFPLVTSIGESAFYNCAALTTVNIPLAKTIGKSAFSSCKALTTAYFPQVKSIGQYVFRDCNALTALILRNDAIVSLNTFVFLNTPIASGTGYIYVPAVLVDGYKTASEWKTYANQIRAIEDYPNICGGATDDDEGGT